MPDFYFARYLPLLIHIAIAGLLAVAMVLLSYFIGQHKFNAPKMSQYECGMQPVGDARQRFSVKFYLVAMLFILFDVEAIFLYPWAIVGKGLKADGLGLFWFCGDAGVHPASCWPACGTSGRRACSTGTSRAKRRRSESGAGTGNHRRGETERAS